MTARKSCHFPYLPLAPVLGIVAMLLSLQQHQSAAAAAPIFVGYCVLNVTAETLNARSYRVSTWWRVLYCIFRRSFSQQATIDRGLTSTSPSPAHSRTRISELALQRTRFIVLVSAPWHPKIDGHPLPRRTKGPQYIVQVLLPASSVVSPITYVSIRVELGRQRHPRNDGENLLLLKTRMRCSRPNHFQVCCCHDAQEEPIYSFDLDALLHHPGTANALLSGQSEWRSLLLQRCCCSPRVFCSQGSRQRRQGLFRETTKRRACGPSRVAGETPELPILSSRPAETNGILHRGEGSKISTQGAKFERGYNLE